MKIIKNTFKFAGRATRSAVDGLVDGVQSEEGKERRRVYRKQRSIERKIRTLAWIGFISSESIMFLYFAYHYDFNGDIIGQILYSNWVVFSVPVVLLICVNTVSNWISKQL